jgi:hypothetical protein
MVYKCPLGQAVLQVQRLGSQPEHISQVTGIKV